MEMEELNDQLYSIRPLNPREASYIYSPSHTVFALSVLLPSPLKELRPSVQPSLDKLAKTYGLLSATIHKVKGGHGSSEFVFLDHSKSPTPTSVTYIDLDPAKLSDPSAEMSEASATGILQDVAAHECDIPFDLSKSLFRVIVQDLGTYSGVVFLFAHTVADGKFGMEVLRSWLEYLSSEMSNADVRDVREVPTLFTDLSPPGYDGVAGWIRYVIALAALIFWTLFNKPISNTILEHAQTTSNKQMERGIDPDAPWSLPRVRSTSATAHLVLNEKQTSSLIRKAKDTGVSLTTLLACLLSESVHRAERRDNSSSSPTPQPHLAALATDTRPSIRPPITSATPGAYNGVLILRFPATPKTLHTQIRSRMHRGEGILSHRFVSTAPGKLDPALISPVAPKSFPPICFTFSNLGNYIFEFGNPKTKPIVTMFSCSVSVGHGAPFNVHAVTVNGKLFLEVAADEIWIGKGRVRAVMRDIESRLEDLISGAEKATEE
ncbi:hypothetical protein HK097_003019 [Rhizophlyctis rosea]|uniref:Alcohol acetyltransferase n=1 Tax=Rhizophlyctis rosea TaxID=64517 RepID=A0AAD5SI46_9FUNG|nr:hypothetical protein HK097_003019 [Rhizophlyctis rosea]